MAAAVREGWNDRRAPEPAARESNRGGEASTAVRKQRSRPLTYKGGAWELFRSVQHTHSRHRHIPCGARHGMPGRRRRDALRREATRGRVESCVRRVFPSARLACFGSGASGLALRGADIDLVVLGVGPECSTAGGGFNKSDRAELVSILRKIERALRRERVVARAQGLCPRSPVASMSCHQFPVCCSWGLGICSPPPAER